MQLLTTTVELTSKGQRGRPDERAEFRETGEERHASLHDKKNTTKMSSSEMSADMSTTTVVLQGTRNVGDNHKKSLTR